MGGIADYSGSLVLQLPLREATFVAIQRCSQPGQSEDLLTFHSPTTQGARAELLCLDRSEWLDATDMTDYEGARERLRSSISDQSGAHWVTYVAGVWLVLRRELDIELPGPALVEIRSDVPEGKGVSSSAALEVATMRAVCAAWDVQLQGEQLALLCQKVENEIAGAPCGVMDQMTSALGQTDRLLALLCRPAQVEGQLEIPAEVAFAGIDSGVRHAVTDSDYSTVRAAAFMGRRMLSQPVRPEWLTDHGPETVDDLPPWISGEEFLGRYGDHDDPATEVVPSRRYPVRAAAGHAVQEHRRVHRFAHLLRGPVGHTELGELGALMQESHVSYNACGLGTPETDRLLELALEEGLPGGRVTGGGSGGTVAVVGSRPTLEATTRRIADRFAKESGHRPHLFFGSSPGALEVEVLAVSDK